METQRIGTTETGFYGAGMDEFAVEHDEKDARAIISVNFEGKSEEEVEELMEEFRDMVSDVGYSIVPTEETTIPKGDL